MPEVVESIRCHPSNCTAGRRGQRVRTVVVHYTGARGSAHENLVYFSRPGAGASAHYFIGKTGDLRRSVPECDTAWHAGNWGVNLSSVGIEVCSAGEPFTEAQVRTLRALVRDLMARYGIPASRVIRHYDVTGKRCPAPYVGEAAWRGLHARITGGGAAAAEPPVPAAGPGGDVAGLARRAIAGEFGNGEERRRRLGPRYGEVQAEVNRIMAGGGAKPAAPAAPGVDVDALARDVIAGRYGNGDERRRRLGADYGRVQRRVNELMAGGGGRREDVDVDALARAVIRGEYGNGEERRRRLGADYDRVQRRVNELMP
jgi:N-acetylmuramoyl-L-alanine amidase